MSTIIGKLSVTTLSISRKANSPIYGIQTAGNVADCFYNSENPSIELNNSVFIIQEVAMNVHRVVDEYELLITHIDEFRATSNGTFTLRAEGKRLNHSSSVKVVDPVISNVYAYRTALALHITGDIEQLFDKGNLTVTPEARAYLSTIDIISHLGTLYKRVTDNKNNYFVYVRDESNQLDIKNIKAGVVLLYSSKEVPVQEDLETVKYISRKLLFT